MTTAIYSHPECKRHEMGHWHPESPARLQAIEDQLIASRIDSLLEYREAPEADVADIRRVHTQTAVDRIRNNVQSLVIAGGDYYPLDADTLVNRHSWNAALRAAGAAVA
jgi:acetoin utilization deacetylase AcuC-like enzyme